MAIVVEDGTGLTNADSYISVADADTYFSILPTTLTSSWDALSTTDKENYLKWATRVLDTKTEFEGDKTVEASALRWPRKCVTDRDGIDIDDNVVPKEVENATVELVRILLGEDITTGQDVDNLKFIKVDVIELEYQDDTAQNRIPAYINDVLNGVGTFTSGRRQAVRITKV